MVELLADCCSAILYDDLFCPLLPYGGMECKTDVLLISGCFIFFVFGQVSRYFDALFEHLVRAKVILSILFQ